MIGTKHVAEVVDVRKHMVGERSVGLGRHLVRGAGGIRNENAGMSMREREWKTLSP